MDSACVRPNLLGRCLAAIEIARPDQHSEAVCYEILRDLKTASLISPGDQGDRFVLHSNLLIRSSFVPFESVPSDECKQPPLIFSVSAGPQPGRFRRSR